MTIAIRRRSSRGLRFLRTRRLAAALMTGTALTGLGAGLSAARAAEGPALPVFLAQHVDLRGFPAVPAMVGPYRMPASLADADGFAAAAKGPSAFETDEYRRSWFLGAIHAADAYAAGYTGKGVVVAVVDSGLDVSHPEFAGRVSPYVRSFAYGGDPRDLSDLNENGTIHGHGTHVAGIVGAARNGAGMQGVAYEATILSLRAIGVPEEKGGAEPAEMAIDYAARHGAKVLNGSFGPPTLPEKWIDDPSRPGGYMPNPHYRVMDRGIVMAFGDMLQSGSRTIRAAADADVVLVFSAGNQYQEQPVAAADSAGYGFLPYIRPDHNRSGHYRFLVKAADLGNPGTYEYADPADPAYADLDFSDLQGALITVVSTGRDNRIASYSNRCGVTFLWCLAAPGGDDARSGQTKEDAEILSTYPYSSYTTMVGTSMAAPVVAGGAAVLRQAFPYMSARQIIELILTTTDDLGSPEIYGRGLFNLGRAVKGPREFGAVGFSPVFDVDTRGYDSVWSNDIAGTGGLIKRGAGNLVLTGTNTYAGGTDIRGGVLTLAGSVASPVTIGTAATLRGTGRIDAPLHLAGTLDPGAAGGGTIGTMTVSGPAILLRSSTYRVDADSRGAHDRLLVGGAASLAGGTLDIVLADGFAPAGKALEIVSAAGGATGTFGTLRSNSTSAFLDPRLHYAGDRVTVSFERNGVPLASAETDPANKNVAAAIDALGGASSLDEAVAVLDKASADRAFDVLSGDLHASAVTAVYGQAQRVQDSLLSHLRQPFSAGAPQVQAAFSADAPQPAAPVSLPVAAFDPQRFALWGTGFGAWGRLRGHGSAASLDTDTGGFLLGAEARLGETWRLGAAGGFARTGFDARARLASGAVETTFGALYGSAGWGGLSLRFGAAFSGHDFATSRSLLFPGFAEAARAAYNGTSLQAFGEAGYRFAFGRLALEPFLGAALLRLSNEGFQEQGGTAALTGLARSNALATATLGLRAEAELGAGLQLSGLVGWRHAAGDVAPDALLAFAGGASAFGVAGVPVDRDALVAEAGLDWQASDALKLGVTYAGQIGPRAQDHSLKGNLTWRF